MISPEQVRARFPALRDGFAFLDNAGGSQVPASVIDAIAEYFRTNYAQTGGTYPASVAAKQTIDGAHAFIAEFMNAGPHRRRGARRVEHGARPRAGQRLRGNPRSRRRDRGLRREPRGQRHALAPAGAVRRENYPVAGEPGNARVRAGGAAPAAQRAHARGGVPARLKPPRPSP